MIEITFENVEGQEIKLNHKEPFMLNSIDGFGDVDAEIQTASAPYVDGSFYIDSKLQEREINLEFTILANSENFLSLYKRIVSNLFNPKYGEGLLRYKRGNAHYIINCVADTVPQFPKGSGNRSLMHQKVILTLIATDPYWRSPNKESKPLQAYVGNFTLPTTFPVEFGSSGASTEINNTSGSPVPVEIEIRGPITNPKIFNRTSDEFIQINRSIQKDEVMVVDTTPGGKRVVVIDEDGNEKNAFGYLDAESTMWKLKLGKNLIEHVADSGNRHAQVTIKWNDRYVGV